MGFFDGLSDLVFGKKAKPYQAPNSSVTLQSSVTPYQTSAQENDATDGLANILRSNSSRYSSGPMDFSLPALSSMALPQAYRDSVLGAAERSANYTADQSAGRYNEQLNNMNLLGSTGHGRGLGEIERARQDNIGTARDRLTQEEFAFQNAERDRFQRSKAMEMQDRDSLLGNMAGLARLLGDRSRTMFDTGLAGANFTNRATLDTANFQNGAARDNAQAARESSEDEADRRMELMKLGVGAATGGFSGAGGAASAGSVFGSGMMPRRRRSANVSGTAGSPGYLMDLLKARY